AASEFAALLPPPGALRRAGLPAPHRPPAGAADPTQYAWNRAPVLAEFPRLLERVTTGAAEIAEVARQTIANDLYLPVDAFVRLMALRSRVLSGLEPLTRVEWSELHAIIVLAYKNFSRDAWRAEERDAGITLDRDTFVGAAVSPVDAAREAWSPHVPAIEPDLLSIVELPASLAGVEARGLYDLRVGELSTNLYAVKQRRAQGLELMLVEGFDARAD